VLSAKPWKSDAVIRLFVSVLICIIAGSLAAALAHELQVGAKASLRFYPVSVAAFVLLGGALVMSRGVWTLDNAVKRMAICLACLYAGLLLVAWAVQIAWPQVAGAPTPVQTPSQMLISLLSFQGATLIWVALFLREHQLGWADAFGFRGHWLRAILVGAVVACVFLRVGLHLQNASQELMKHLLHLNPEEQLPVQTLRGAVSWGDRLMLGIPTILLAPVAEELLFRGILYPWIKRAGFPRLALWGTSLFFAGMHLNLEVFVPLFALALGLVALYEWTGNLLAPISAHVLFNALNFFLLYSQGGPAKG
jgi:membrane protease YdiL (CAAX protease family)